MVDCAHPASTGGAYRDRHGRWKRDAVDEEMFQRALARRRMHPLGREGVWSRPPDAGVKPEGDDLQATEAIKARSPRRARYKR